MFDEATLSARLTAIFAAHQGIEGPLLPILHAIQHEFDHIPEAAIPQIARHLNLSGAEVYGVITFYHDFRQKPAPRHSVKLCRAEACQAMGADHLADHAKKHLGIDWHETTADGKIGLEPTFCLGLCACGPAAMIDGRPVGQLDEKRLETVLNEVRS